MAQASTAMQIRHFVSERYIRPARRRGERRVTIVAGDVHRGLNLTNRVPNVCQVLESKKLREENHLEIEQKSGPPSGMGTRMTYVYRILESPDTETTVKDSSFDRLRGLLEDVYQSLGGGEAYLKNERNKFNARESGK